LDTHRPEGFRMQHFALKPFSPQKRRGSGKNNSYLAVQHLSMNSARPCLRDEEDLVTALRIFRPALGVSVTVQDGKPAGITCPKHKEMQGEILWAAGPWRSSGDWWEQEGWARDEWDIAVQGKTGIALYRLVHDLLGAGWFLEGSYD